MRYIISEYVSSQGSFYIENVLRAVPIERKVGVLQLHRLQEGEGIALKETVAHLLSRPYFADVGDQLVTFVHYAVFVDEPLESFSLRFARDFSSSPAAKRHIFIGMRAGSTVCIFRGPLSSYWLLLHEYPLGSFFFGAKVLRIIPWLEPDTEENRFQRLVRVRQVET